jgi:diacylglycerol kinase (ATP)
MAGTGLDALMIRDADAGLKDKVGRLAYVWTGAKNLRKASVKMRIEVDGTAWFKGKASCLLIGNVGDVIGGISVFPDAQPDDGLLNLGVVTASGAMDWVRTLGRSVIGDAEGSLSWRRRSGEGSISGWTRPSPTRSTGGVRKKTKRLKCKVEPGAITVHVPREEGR